MTPYINPADLRGYSRMIIGAAGQVTDLVEEMHSTIAAPFSPVRAAAPGRTAPGRPASGRTRGITGLVYRSIHGVYRLVDAGLDAVLGQVTPLLGDRPSAPERETLLAILNGVLGDQLAARDNPLAIEMSLRSGGQSLVLEKHALQAAIPHASPKLLVLAHGLCMNDLQWSCDGHDHGAALAADFDYTPVYLHYNSGLHISTNGRQFADLLEALTREWPQPVEELVIVGYSMGGLVARSACHYAALAGHTWRQHLRKLIFLGTPHHGSPLERAGHWVDLALEARPYTAPLRRLGMNRSAGITDLRYGNLLDEDWAGLGRFAHRPDDRQPVPLPDDVCCYAIAATRGCGAGDLKEWLLGDGLVPLPSALGHHEDPTRHLAFPQSQQWVGYNMGHTDLLCRADVYQKLKEWLAE